MKADLDKMNQTVTLAEVAEAAGVSVMTVSRALRNAHDCSIKTRERIQALATKMGYTPNPLVSAFQANIRNRRNREYVATIGWLNDFPVCGFFSEWRGIEGKRI